MKQWNQKKIRIGLNLLLVIALAVTLLAPAANRTPVQPDNPVSEANILPIETVNLGQSAGESLAQRLQSLGTGGQQGQQSQEQEQPDQEQPEQQNPAQPQPDDTTGQQPQPAPQPQPSNPQNNGDGDQDNQAQEGEDGGEELEADLALVLTWYKYGSQAKTVVCTPNSAVGRTIQDTQLEDGRLRYQLAFSGLDSGDAEITRVQFGLLNAVGRDVDESGQVDLTIPQGQSDNAYGFQVEAVWHTRDADGVRVDRPLTFRIAIYYESGLDLEMELTWTDKAGAGTTLRCGADKQTSGTVRSSRLQLGSLPYALNLTGESARDAVIQSVTWRNETGESGQLAQSGSLTLKAPDTGRQDYTVTAQVEVEGKIVTFTWVLHFESTLDLDLSFTWYENGTVAHTVQVEANGSTSLVIRRNQLSGDQLRYELALTGESAAQASILSATLEGGSGSLTVPGGSTFLTMPQDGDGRFTMKVTARVGGDQAETAQFTVPIRYVSDVSLQMSYPVLVDGTQQTMTVSCENQREAQAAAIYDSQLTDGQLSYTLKLTGDDAGAVSITSVTCYQSGSGRTVTLAQPDGTMTLLLADGGKEGENAFTVQAKDQSGSEYTFKINVPYRHTGQDLVQISVLNLTDGQVVANESEVTIAITAWTEDAAGKVVEYVLQDGLTVQLDGKTYHYSGTAGHAQQYTLIPENPESGDKNTHELCIRAEDSLGNYGEKRIQFQGERSQAGQIIGEATIYVDLSVLGLGTRGPIRYDVLKDEPVSYVIAKALWDYEDGTFGAAKESFGWPQGTYSGTLDDGFYLRRFGDGSDLGDSAQALTGNGWKSLGSTQEEVWQSIDNRFGAGSNLAILWRCIYNNGVALGTVENPYSIGEFDFTSGSGWMYSIGGQAFYPGTSMSAYYLQDGDTLTLRFTLAYGWDVGSGQKNNGYSVGYCIQCLNGSFTVHHDWQTVTLPDGTTERRCHSCGMVEGCEHLHTQWQETEDGLCGEYCLDCGKYIREPQAHDWEIQYREDDDQQHWMVCRNCKKEEAEAHSWKEQSNTATCTEPGEITYTCDGCHGTRTEQVEALGHNPEGVWQVEAAYHYQICARCKEEIPETRSSHQYSYDGSDWVCAVCHCYHDWECGNDQCTVISSTCQKQTLQCAACGLTLERTGTFEEYHHYENGTCIYCGSQDPNYNPPTEPDPPVDPEEPEEPDVTD